MAYEDLITAVEVSAKERIHEIQERSKNEADGIIRDAKAKDGPIRKRHLDRATTEVEVQKNRLLSTVREDSRRKLLEVKNEIFDRAFAEAGQDLSLVRERPQYKAVMKTLMGEVFHELGKSEVVLHIDPRDSVLCRELLATFGANCDIVPDLSCSGGLNAHSRDERFMVFNTIEDRLKQVKAKYRPEIVAILFGD